MTRPRKRGQKDLPANLYQAGGRFRYRHPVTGKYHGMGKDRQAAINAARKLNGILEEEPADLVNRVLGGRRDVDRVVERYMAEHLEQKPLAASTLSCRRAAANRFKKQFNGRSLDELTVLDLADYLNASAPTMYRINRKETLAVFEWAGSQGLIEDNVALRTMGKEEPKKQRRRLNLQQFKLVHAAAPDWLQLAMEISLLTLQSVSEIALMRFDHVVEADGGRHLQVVRQKTRNKTDRAYISILVTPELDRLLRRARSTGIASPMVVHRMPTRRTKKRREQLQHITALKPRDLTEAFREARIAAGLDAKIPAKKRPTYHEIRSLGSHLYEEAGYPVEYVQALMGHSSADQSRYYQSGYGPKWHLAAAELDLGGVLGR